jgi:uncharacterized membrane protein YdjX (TVP38/TMEM64 family)
MSTISTAPRDLGLGKRRGYVKHLRQSQLGKHRWRIGLGLIFVATCIVCGFFLWKNQDNVIQLFDNAGPWGAIGFIVGLSIAIILLLPTPFIKIFGGAIFPLHIAIIVNFVGTMLGGIGAFLFGRWLFRDGLVEAISNNDKLQKIDAAMGEESMQISVLVRLSPLIPDEWLNYILAAGPINLKTFSISNCASIIYCLVYSYYGWAFGQIALKEGGLSAFSESSGALIMMVLGIIATVVATVIVTRVTMKALQDAIDGEVAV